MGQLDHQLSANLKRESDMETKEAIEEIDRKLVEVVDNADLPPEVSAHLCIAGNHLLLALLALAANEKSES